MRRILFLVLNAVAALFISHQMTAQTPDFKEPDFAYPKTVESDARALLQKASALEGDASSVTRLRAVLEICAAQTQIDRAASFAQPEFIAEQAEAAQGAGRAMLLALEASKYAQIYNSNRWNYDRVDAPLEPYPADVSEWSGLQFRTRIAALFDQAIAMAPDTPLSVFESSVEYSPEALQYIPTVKDFVRYRAFATFGDIGCRDQAAAVAGESLELAAMRSPAYFFWIVQKDSNDYKVLTDIYTKNADVEAARFVLEQIVNAASYIIEEEVPADGDTDAAQRSVRDRKIAMIRESLAKFPSWYNNASLKNALAGLTQPKVSYTYPNMVSPGSDIVLSCEYSFAKNIEASLYALTVNADYIDIERLVKQPKAASASYTPADTDGKADLKIKAPEPGNYALIVTVDGKPASDRGWNVPQIMVTPLVGFAVNGCKESAVVAVDYTTGMPLAGVTVKSEIVSSRNNAVNSSTLIGKTGGDGFLITDALPLGTRNQYCSFTYQGRPYIFSNQVRLAVFHDGSRSAEQLEANLMTDRALYHPGDTVQWAIAVSRLGIEKDAVPVAAADMKLTVEFKDVNGQPVGSAEVSTDRFGRAYGSFPTKEGALTGSYTFRIKEIRQFYGRVMVSDFRLPVFEAKIDKIERDVPAAGDVRVSGSARTFTGMAVAGAKVKLTLTGAHRWRWFYPAEELATYDTVTAADGTFSLVLPASVFKSTDTKYTDFIIEADVTSAAAETAQASRNFTIGKPYGLVVSRVPGKADTSDPVEAVFEAYDADDKPVKISVDWSLGIAKGDSLVSVVASGTGISGEPVKLNLGSVPAGVYTFRVEAADSTLADPVTGPSVTLYNVSKNRVPQTDSPVFVPVDFYGSGDRKVKVLAGVAGSGKVCAFVAVRSEENLISFRREMLKPGFSHINIDVPYGSDKLQVLIITVRDGKTYSEDITVSRPKAAPVKIVVESFRDKLIPGIGETWRFRLTDGDGKALDAAMVATMYNKALDKLYTGTWPSGFMTVGDSNWLRVNAPYNNSNRRYADVDINYLDNVVRIVWPQYRWCTPYGFNVVSGLATGTTMRSYAAAAPARAMMKNEMLDAAAPEAVEEMEEEAADSAVAGAEAKADGDAQEKFDYRVAEQLQIFWQPALVADADGNIDIVFTMPNAVGTWQVKAFAWTPELKAAAYAAECMSTKLVMVQPNLPRFLRQGDKARVLATVYNNSDADAAVTTTVELFDIATGKTTASAVSTDSIAKGASAMVAIDIDVPVDASAIGYRVRSVSGAFSDGEQSAIPVLASSSTVVESTEFYLNPGEKKPFELTVPATGDATVTLQYCQNPIWTVVKAMRGIYQPGNTSNSIVSSLFSVLAGNHITSTNPAIAGAIAEWKKNPGEEALVSMLEKNEELKKLLLDQTPWVQTAKDQSARMSSLSEFLDPETTANAIARRTADLADLRNRDGGFAWGPWSNESSVWATETVLTTLGLASSLGLLPQSDTTLRAMLQPAFDYLQAEAVKPNRPATDRSLALIAALLPELKVSAGADRILRATIADIAKNWRRDGSVGKAYDIIILNANGRRSLAADVLASVRQHSVEQPGKGLCFPNVGDVRGYATIIQAYAAMGASAAEIDGMRQWITVYAQANDNLGAYNPDYIIAAVLLTGSDWTSVPVKENVTVDGRPVVISKIESATGYFAQTIETDGTRPVTITVQPNGVTPSYGSVVTVGRRPMASIKAKAGSDISIDKRVLVQRGGEWVETTAFALGERVRVQLVIKAGRDLQYVSVDDERSAAFEPVDQLPGYVYDGSLGFYRENGDANTRLFIGFLPKGTYHVSYDMTAAVAGDFRSGMATVQSQYAPEITAHSGTDTITVEARR